MIGPHDIQPRMQDDSQVLLKRRTLTQCGQHTIPVLSLDRQIKLVNQLILGVSGRHGRGLSWSRLAAEEGDPQAE